MVFLKRQPKKGLVVELEILIGSDNPVKMQAVRGAFARAFPDNTLKVTGHAVRSDVPPQPIGFDQLVAGAQARALGVLRCTDSLPSERFGVGIEAGLVAVPGTVTGYFDYQIAAVADQNRRITLGSGPGFEYPPQVIREVLGGREVGEVVGDLCQNANQKREAGAIGWLSSGLLDRAAVLELAVLLALMPRLHPAYGAQVENFAKGQI
jgi:inosine/xanthosine triphosphatase